ncbi:adenylate/guanylate cyclase domain-containing protein [Croceitalea rosinachiae]|uniref:Adenylate/guanylate cyclase domain-containing protein n=1 Tax=Croceitalea rosinachiae TaxID=3075596 RepID=A0ABU3AA46_9FLAO|nr:adenylate/guanylate cyclase domain-containing protein [Croceitalea sp. F388]MDT0607062.1 adenylate/guanylate cyclase domain-containing protein [Croceitalea sp. F388]
MSISAKNKYYLKRILPFGIIWLSIALLIMWSQYAVNPEQIEIIESDVPLTFEIVIFASVSIFLVGCIVGCIEVFIVNKLFIRQSFPKKIIGKLLLYTLVLSVLVLILYLLAASIVSNASMFSKKIWGEYVAFFLSITHISTWIQLLFSLLASLLYAEVSENLGQNILYNFFTGRYHRPVDENRIFMFVDMKDSTTIAEKLGHKTYFKLLRDYYRSFSDAIIKNYGEVYQYVGDEIVITWKLDNGLKNNRCIQCFFEMKDALKKQEDTFNRKYNSLPDFKAALHFGQVTTGEIGALKKDIFFTGDVLNTTARILGLTTELKEDLLISEPLSRKLEFSDNYSIKDLGTKALKGKTQSIKIFAIHHMKKVDTDF